MKKILAVLSILLVCVSLSSCQSEQTWYLDNTAESAMNTITVRKTDSEHLHVKAVCRNGAATGCLEEDFTLIAEDLAVFSGRNDLGHSYTIVMSFTDKRLNVSVGHDNNADESEALWFGDSVTLSGRYTTQPPEYKTANIVMDKVFHSDAELAKAVEEVLGEEEYAVFIRDFGMSTYIHEDKVNGRSVIKGNLKGLGDWCGFYSDPDGFFYGVYNHKCFSNDPVFQHNPPDFLMSLY